MIKPQSIPESRDLTLTLNTKGGQETGQVHITVIGVKTSLYPKYSPGEPTSRPQKELPRKVSSPFLRDCRASVF